MMRKPDLYILVYLNGKSESLLPRANLERGADYIKDCQYFGSPSTGFWRVWVKW